MNIFLSVKDQTLAWIEVEPNAENRPIEGIGQIHAMRTYVGEIRPIPEAVEYIVSFGDDGLWPWCKRIDMRNLCAQVFPGISFQLKHYGSPSVDAYNECQFVRDLLRRCIQAKGLTSMDDVHSLCSAVIH